MLLFLADLIYYWKLENFVLFNLFPFFNFIILHSRATSIWYQSITLIRDQIIILVLHQFDIKATSIQYQVTFICFKFLIRDHSFLFGSVCL